MNSPGFFDLDLFAGGEFFGTAVGAGMGLRPFCSTLQGLAKCGVAK
jgi:hypothetical protein